MPHSGAVVTGGGNTAPRKRMSLNVSNGGTESTRQRRATIAPAYAGSSSPTCRWSPSWCACRRSSAHRARPPRSCRGSPTPSCCGGRADVRGRARPQKVYRVGLALCAAGAAVALCARGRMGRAGAGRCRATALSPVTLALISHAVPDSPLRRARCGRSATGALRLGGTPRTPHRSRSTMTTVDPRAIRKGRCLDRLSSAQPRVDDDRSYGGQPRS